MKGMVGLLWDDRYLLHETEPLHPEGPERLELLYKELKGRGSHISIAPRPATRQELLLVHDPSYIEQVEATKDRGGRLSEDTWAGARSYEVACLAVGGVLEVVDQVLAGKVRSAFALVRPPGHHALGDRAMGFCIFNNVAIAARYALERHGLRRVMIVDWDVHHGNGTQEAFLKDQRVLYFSVHQYPHFPDTGYFDEVGEGEGAGYTVNVPLPLGCGDSDYGNIFRHLLIPLAQQFVPELVLVSAGFDPHQLDPLGGMYLSDEGFGRLADLVLGLSEELCGGRVVFVLEGGHHPEALCRSVLRVIDRLIDPGTVDSEAFGRREDEDLYKIERILKEAKGHLSPYWRL